MSKARKENKKSNITYDGKFREKKLIERVNNKNLNVICGGNSRERKLIGRMRNKNLNITWDDNLEKMIHITWIGNSRERNYVKGGWGC